MSVVIIALNIEQNSKRVRVGGNYIIKLWRWKEDD
jgi:hypothetical protein